jgi:hypothetical protein
MKHAELLARLDYHRCVYTPALRAVVELHTAGNGEASRCEACYMGFDCPTIQAIEKELQ